MRNPFSKYLLCVLVACSSTTLFSQTALIEIPAARELIAESGFTGTTLVLNARTNEFFTGNPELVDQEFLPASTFKVFSALVALQTGIVSNKDTVLLWDGIERSRPEINRDLDLRSAFQLSAVPHFQHLVRTIGEEQMQQFLDLADYGNRNMAGGLDQFWLSGELRISPREQIQFLARLYANELPFSMEVMQEVREIMQLEVTDNFSLHAKTGWATPNETDNTGWWTGWVEKADGPYFFATVLQTTMPGETFGSARLEITRQVLALLKVL